MQRRKDSLQSQRWVGIGSPVGRPTARQTGPGSRRATGPLRRGPCAYTASSRSSPHIFSSAYIDPSLWLEQMHHDVAGIDQYPVRSSRALDLDTLQAGILELFTQMLCHRADLPVSQPRGDHHPIAEHCLTGEIHGDDVLGLVVLKAGHDHTLQTVQLRNLGFQLLYPGSRGLLRAGRNGFLAWAAGNHPGFRQLRLDDRLSWGRFVPCR